MVFVPKDRAVGIHIRGTLNGEQVENTLYFADFEGSGVTDELLLLASDIMTWWQNGVMLQLTDGYALREVYAVDMSSNTAPTATAVPSTPSVGGQTEDSLPNNVSLCVSFRTGGRGRSSRGRNYISGLPDNAVTTNNFSSVVSDAIKAEYEKLLDDTLLRGTWTWVVYSRYERGIPRTEAYTPAIDAVVLTDTVVDSQRRRLPKRGR
jgi:hypothetical protein